MLEYLMTRPDGGAFWYDNKRRCKTPTGVLHLRLFLNIAIRADGFALATSETTSDLANAMHKLDTAKSLSV